MGIDGPCIQIAYSAVCLKSATYVAKSGLCPHRRCIRCGGVRGAWSPCIHWGDGWVRGGLGSERGEPAADQRNAGVTIFVTGKLLAAGGWHGAWQGLISKPLTKGSGERLGAVLWHGRSGVRWWLWGGSRAKGPASHKGGARPAADRRGLAAEAGARRRPGVAPATVAGRLSERRRADVSQGAGQLSGACGGGVRFGRRLDRSPGWRRGRRFRRRPIRGPPCRGCNRRRVGRRKRPAPAGRGPGAAPPTSP